MRIPLVTLGLGLVLGCTAPDEIVKKEYANRAEYTDRRRENRSLYPKKKGLFIDYYLNGQGIDTVQLCAGDGPVFCGEFSIIDTSLSREIREVADAIIEDYAAQEAEHE